MGAAGGRVAHVLPRQQRRSDSALCPSASVDPQDTPSSAAPTSAGEQHAACDRASLPAVTILMIHQIC